MLSLKTLKPATAEIFLECQGHYYSKTFSVFINATSFEAGWNETVSVSFHPTHSDKYQVSY
jgi:hypothetical protein